MKIDSVLEPQVDTGRTAVFWHFCIGFILQPWRRPVGHNAVSPSSGEGDTGLCPFTKLCKIKICCKSRLMSCQKLFKHCTAAASPSDYKIGANTDDLCQAIAL